MNICQNLETMNKQATHKVLLDTSFLIRLLDENSNLHQNALDYYRFFLENGYELYVSTISVAEYCVKGHIEHLPWDVLHVIPFNLDHAKLAGVYAAIIYEAREKGVYVTEDRLIIPNDTMIFSQVELSELDYFATSDTKSANAIRIVSDHAGTHFRHLDIHTPYTEMFGVLGV